MDNNEINNTNICNKVQLGQVTRLEQIDHCQIRSE